MIDKQLLKRVKNNAFTLKHIPQAEIDKISRVNLILFVFWLGKDNVIIKHNFFRYSKETEITLYKEMGYNHYDGINYPPLFFLQCYMDFTYKQALYLLNYYYYKVSKSAVEQEFKKYLSTDRTDNPSTENIDLQYIKKENLLNSADKELKAQALKRVYGYLTSRSFERFVIQNMISQEWLMVDEKFNLCFITYEDTTKEKIIAITKKGTLSGCEYKCNYTSERNTGFYFTPKGTETPSTLIIFESCLDLFSFVQLIWLGKITISNYACISLNGANNIKYIYKVLDKHPSIKNIICCLDNDEKGIQATKVIKRQIINNFYDLRPILKDLTQKNNGKLIKDWNEALTISSEINIDLEQLTGINKPK